MKSIKFRFFIILLQLIFALFVHQLVGAPHKKVYLSTTKTMRAPIKPDPKKHRFTIALFDTARRCSYTYNPFIEIAKSTGFKIDYYSLPRLLDTPNKKIPFDQYQGAFFVICPEFLKAMKHSPAAKKILYVLKKFYSYPNKLTSLMFPSLNPANRRPLVALEPLLHQLGMNVHLNSITQPEASQENKKLADDLTMLFNVGNRFLRFSPDYRSYQYHTTLNIPRTGRPFNVQQNLSEDIMSLALLPLNQTSAKPVQNTLPYGVYWFNPARKNHLVLGNVSALSASGISENFQFCPMNFELRKDIHNEISQMMWELYLILTQGEQHPGIDIPRIQKYTKTPLPKNLMQLGKKHTAKVIGKTPYKTAWMEILPFEQSNKKKEQTQLIRFILNSGIDSLWISLKPNIYFSPIANNKRNINQFLASVSRFTKMLKRESHKKRIHPPKILIGFEIVENIGAASQAARDVYGNHYPDVPRPLDANFWINEVKTPLEKFVATWKDPAISNGIELAGILLDLEMYGRKATGSFLPTMGFEPETIKPFVRIPLASNISPDHFAQYLMDNTLSTDFFDHLEKEAAKLGTYLRKCCNKTLPNGIIGCYAPNISTDWFYKGFYKGLSTQKNPIELFTFNAEFKSHKKWLENNGIYAHHSCVLMLSKVRDKKDFTLVDDILQRHDGVWFNRFSRIIEPVRNDWSNLEQTTMNMEEREAFAQYLNQTQPLPLDDVDEPLIPQIIPNREKIPVSAS